jgi:enamine deaminase RidA (YjgF/YER057c/UK114 family)
MTIKRIDVGARMSQAVSHDGRVFLAGIVADDASGDVADQTRQILARIDTLLSLAGTDKSKALAVTVWLADIDDFATMNAVYDTWVHPVEKPVRVCVESRLAGPHYRVAIQLTAAL